MRGAPAAVAMPCCPTPLPPSLQPTNQPNKGGGPALRVIIEEGIKSPPRPPQAQGPLVVATPVAKWGGGQLNGYIYLFCWRMGLSYVFLLSFFLLNFTIHMYIYESVCIHATTPPPQPPYNHTTTPHTHTHTHTHTGVTSVVCGRHHAAPPPSTSRPSPWATRARFSSTISTASAGPPSARCGA